MSNMNKYSKLIREKKPNRDINFIYDSSDMTEPEESDKSTQVYHGKQDFQKDTKMSQQYKSYAMSQSQQEDALHSLSDSRNDALFVDKENTKLIQEYKNYGVRQSQQENIFHSSSDSNSNSFYIDKEDAKLRDQYKNYTISQSHQEDVSQSFTDGRNDTFVDKENTKLIKEYKNYGVRQSWQENTDSNINSLYIDKGYVDFNNQTFTGTNSRQLVNCSTILKKPMSENLIADDENNCIEALQSFSGVEPAFCHHDADNTLPKRKVRKLDEEDNIIFNKGYVSVNKPKNMDSMRDDLFIGSNAEENNCNDSLVLDQGESSKNFNNKGGRPKNPNNETYPMDNATFQRKIIMSQHHLKMKINKIEKTVDMAVGLLQQLLDKGSNIVTFDQVTSMDDLIKFEIRLKDNIIKEKLTRKFEAMGLVSKDSKAHCYAILDSLMTEEVQSKVNVMYGNQVPNKNYTDHLSLTHDLPLIFSSILASLATWKVPEKLLKSFLSERLKQGIRRAHAAKRD